MTHKTKQQPFSSIACVDLFCGIGGLTYGLTQEGIPVVAGIDNDPNCQFAYEKNNDAKFVYDDIAKRGVAKIISKYLDQGTIRVLAGCAPCQPFSTYRQGYHNELDEKWSLITNFANIIAKVEPDVVTMENVPSIEKHDVFSKFVSKLKCLGYEIWASQVDCSQYGVPQTRTRLVLLASRLGPIELIPPTRKNPKTVRSAIGKLQHIEAGETSSKDLMHKVPSLSEINLHRIRASKPGGTWRDWPKNLIAACHKRDSGKTYSGVYGRMEWDKPAPTVTTQCYGYGNGRFGHPEQDRAISLREASILQGFPRRYKFVPTGEPVAFDSVGRMIGNAVPVDLARAIGRSIKEHIINVGVTY